MKKIKFILITFLVLLVTGICTYFLMPLINKINFGLDLQGGFEVLYEVSPINTEDKINRTNLNQYIKQLKGLLSLKQM